jgi:hypothetical protein
MANLDILLNGIASVFCVYAYVIGKHVNPRWLNNTAYTFAVLNGAIVVSKLAGVAFGTV